MLSASSHPDRSGSLLTTDEVAAMLRVSARTIRRLGAGGELSRVRIGPRTVRYTPESVEALIHAHNDEAPPAITQTALHESSGGRARHGTG